jgi:hypothetical protein
LGQEGNFAEAIRELDPLQDKPDIALAVCAALMTVHKGASMKGTISLPSLRCLLGLLAVLIAGITIDKEALNKLKEKLKVLSKSVSRQPVSPFVARFHHCLLPLIEQ